MLTEEKYRRIRVDQLVEGSRLKSPILDEHGLVLLQPDVEITDAFRDSLIDRGIEFVAVATPSKPGHPSHSHQAVGSRSPKQSRTSRHGQTYSSERAFEFANSIHDANTCIEHLGEQLAGFTGDDALNSNPSDTSTITNLPDVFLKHLLDDSDQMLAAASDYQTEINFADRCSRMCLLSMETAIEMGWDGHDVIRVGTSALLHDIGLFCGPAEFRNPTAILSADQAWEYRKHPRIAERFLPEIANCDPVTCRIAAQVHERLDGSGYPECLTAHRIHPAAKVIAVVDAYLTLTSAGPGRPPMTPHGAMNYVLIESMRRSLDEEAVEAFIANMCLFPINSRVVLQDGREGTVVRRNQDQCAAPFVQVSPDEEFVATDRPATAIRDEVPNESVGQMRIPNQILSELDWSMVDTHPALAY